MTEVPETPTTTDSAPAKGADSTGGATQPEAKTFTQADLDRIAGETRKSAKEKAVADLLKELELDDAASLKTLVADAKKRKTDEMTESEKATARAEAAEAKRLEAEQKLADYEAKQALRERNSALVSAAQTAGMTTPEDAIGFLKENAPADLDALKADANGKYDDKALKTLVERVRKDRPAWFKPTSPGTPPLSGGRAVQPGKEANDNARAHLSQRVRSGF